MTFGRIPGSRPTGQAPLRGLDAPRFDPAQRIADKLIDLQLERHAWLIRAGEQIRQWRAEDEANGIVWESTREAGEPNKQPASNHGD